MGDAAGRKNPPRQKPYKMMRERWWFGFVVELMIWLMFMGLCVYLVIGP